MVLLLLIVLAVVGVCSVFTAINLGQVVWPFYTLRYFADDSESMITVCSFFPLYFESLMRALLLCMPCGSLFSAMLLVFLSQDLSLFFLLFVSVLLNQAFGTLYYRSDHLQILIGRITALPYFSSAFQVDTIRVLFFFFFFFCI